MNDIKKNYIYNLLYEIFVLAFPMILVPYTSKVLGATAIGVYSYANSIVNYFMMFGMLGISSYGSRKIAKSRETKEKVSVTFFEIYAIQFVLLCLMLILYLLYILFFVKENIGITVMQTLFLLANFFDFGWVFSGLEKFKVNLSRNIFFKLLTFALILIFVKTPQDLWKYTLILSISTLICNLYWIKEIKKEVILKKVSYQEIKPNLKPIFLLFIPILSKSIYQSMDKIMLGSLTTMTEVGLYEQAAKFLKIPWIFVSALSTVMIPRNTKLIVNHEQDKVLKSIEKSIYYIMLIILPIIFGLLAISDLAIPYLLGEEFQKSSTILKILLISNLFVDFSYVIKSEYMVPHEKDNIYIGSTLVGAILNVFLNFILIPRYSSIGVAYATLITEFFVMLYQLGKVRKELPLWKYILRLRPILLKCLIMFLIVKWLGNLKVSINMRLITQICVGVFIYGLLNLKDIFKILNIKRMERKLGKE